MSNRTIVSSPSAEARLERAAAWLAQRGPCEQVLILGATYEAATELARRVAPRAGASFGWQRSTLGRVASALAGPALAKAQLAPVGALPLEALCARVVDRLRREGYDANGAPDPERGLGRFHAVASLPGLPRALARTLGEIRLAGVDPARLAEAGAPELRRVHDAYEAELARARIADRAQILRVATDVARGSIESRGSGGAEAILDRPLLLLDVPLAGALERDLVAALAARAPAVFAAIPAGDERSLALTCHALDASPEAVPPPGSAKSSLHRLQAHLFSDAPAPRGALGDDVVLLSAPGESRECVELARLAQQEASRGVPLDRMAILLRAPAQYRAHLEEALRRAGLPAYFAKGTVRPDPSGRAFVALLGCAAERLSARRFSEYLSLGQVPEANAKGEPPPELPPTDRWVPPDDELVRAAVLRGGASEVIVEALTDEDHALRAAAAEHEESSDEDDDSVDDLDDDEPAAAAIDDEAWAPDSDTNDDKAANGAVNGVSPPKPPVNGVSPYGAPASGASAHAARALTAAGPALPRRPPPPEENAKPKKAPVRAPRRWENLLVESAVIGGLDRWQTRLEALRGKLALDLAEYEDTDDAAAERAQRSLDDLDGLCRFSLPLLNDLDALPREAKWGAWLERLSALATRALRVPDRVLAVLAELTPMADVGPVTLAEVRLVLARRLTELVVAPDERAAGRLFVAPVEAARGLAFDVVFVPGLAEKLFPQKVGEDPILLDRLRAPLGLDTNHERVAAERLALRLAAGAARRRLVLSYPRIDLDQSRPRVPSFYGLEVIRAAEGTLPGFDELARRAEQGGAARIGWPAPPKPELAIDEAEYDLALLETLFQRPENETMGAAHYLLGANEHLARALRFRARRWTLKKWAAADGLVDPAGPARAALDRHALAERSYSPTALQHFASCPYRFFLYAVHKLAPTKAPQAIEEMDPLQRGSLVHDTLFELHAALRDDGAIPVTADNLEHARARLDEVLDRVAERYKSDLAPAIDRVWEDGIAGVRADLREWLRRAAEEGAWVPWRFELSFGLKERRARDPGSTAAPVELDCGIKLRGSIDLVERSTNGALRATDYKTGKAQGKPGQTVIGGGRLLQPVFYGLVLEKLFPGARVEAGRLYFCTSQGGFEEVPIPIDEGARRAAQTVADVVGRALIDGFLPAAPDKGACDYCDYRVVCGPYEEMRTARKSPERLHELRVLRSQP